MLIKEARRVATTDRAVLYGDMIENGWVSQWICVGWRGINLCRVNKCGVYVRVAAASRRGAPSGSARSQQIGVYTYVRRVTLAKLFFTPKTGTKPSSSRVIDASKPWKLKIMRRGVHFAMSHWLWRLFSNLMVLLRTRHDIEHIFFWDIF